MDDWCTVLVKEHTPIIDAVKVIDQGGIGTVVVVDDTNRLQGIVTDGDVRRSILHDVSMCNPVSSIMSVNPKIAKVGDSKKHILALMRSFSLQHIPIVDEQERIVGLEVLNRLVKPQQRDNWVVIMAGGLGTRLKPLTDDCPKPLLRIESKPVLEIILERLMEYGFHNFLFSINYRGQMIQDYFANGEQWGANIQYLEETKTLGTAGPLSLLKEKPNLPMIVMNGDIMTRMNFHHLLEFHYQQGVYGTICVREFQYTVPYGVVNIENNQLVSMEEKPTHFHHVNAGVYVFEPEVLDLITPDQCLDMPDLIQQMLNQQMPTAAFPLSEYWLDIGRHEDFQRAHQDYKEYFA